MHIIYIPFSGVGLFDDPDDDAWLVYRINLFKKYTLKSILNQSLRPDLLWLSFDGRRNNPWIKALDEYLKDKISTVITYNGLIYKDDKYIIRLKGTQKYQSTWTQIYRMFGRAIKKRKLKIFTRYLYRLFFKNLTLESRLKKALKELRPYVNKQQNEYIWLTRIDSDDCLHRRALKEINLKYGWKKVFYYQKALLYNTNKYKLAGWNPQTCPQTFHLSIPTNYFHKARLFKKYWGNYISHEDVPYVFNAEPYLGQFLMLIHGNQISSTWNHRFKGKTIKDQSVLKDYALS